MPGPVLSADEQRAYRAIARYADLFELQLTHGQCQALARTSAEAVLRGRPRDPSPSGLPPVGTPGALGLRAEDLAVLRLVASGLTNRMVAERLDMTVEAAKHRVRRLYVALGVDSRAGLVGAARAAGVVPVEAVSS